MSQCNKILGKREEIDMPLVRIDMMKGKAPEYKKQIMRIVHEALVKVLGIEDWDRFQRIVEIDREDFELPDGKSDDFLYIELTLFPGRSREQKKAVIETVTADLNSELGIAMTDVFIVIYEPPYENWGTAGKQKEG